MGLRMLTKCALAAAALLCLAGQSVFAEAEGVFSDNATCGTEKLWMQKTNRSEKDIQACSNEGMCDVPANRNARIPDSTTPIMYVRLAVHILRNDDGSNPISSDANTQIIINNLNADYLPSRIQFEPYVDYVNATQWRTLSESEIFAMKQASAYKPDSFLNVWATTVDFGYSYGTFPFDPEAQTEQGGIVMGHFHWTTSSHVFAHEVGHCLGLYHTFNGVDEVSACGPCYEAVNSPDKDVRGDRCSDTDPAPTVTGCSVGGNDACSGLPWGPALNNLHSYMSYSSCTQFFTPQQMGRMQCWTDDALTSWVANVRITADKQVGHVPLEVEFDGLTAKSVNTWDWDFGDGGSGAVQSPIHTYTVPGLYGVSVTIQTNDGSYTTSNEPYIAAQADTVKVVNTSGGAGDSVLVTISCHNYIPLTELKIPFTWDGPFGMTLTDITTTGLRTDYMGLKQITSYIPATSQAAFKISAGSQAPLPPGTGPIMTLHFVIPEGATGGPNPIVVGTYGSQELRFDCAVGHYEPSAVAGNVAAGICGDVNNNGVGPTVQDLTYLVNFLFASGPQPPVLTNANVNGTGGVTVTDLTYLVNFLFAGGPSLHCQ